MVLTNNKDVSYIPSRSTLVDCEKRVAADFIESLGIRNYSSPIAPRPSFEAESVKELYAATQHIVDRVAGCKSQTQVKQSMASIGFLGREVEDLLARFGSRVWGEERGHLISAVPNTAYPRNLHFGVPADDARILFLLRGWIAQRAFRKAGLKGTKENMASSASQKYASADMSLAEAPTSAMAGHQYGSIPSSAVPTTVRERLSARINQQSTTVDQDSSTPRTKSNSPLQSFRPTASESKCANTTNTPQQPEVVSGKKRAPTDVSAAEPSQRAGKMARHDVGLPQRSAAINTNQEGRQMDNHINSPVIEPAPNLHSRNIHVYGPRAESESSYGADSITGSPAPAPSFKDTSGARRAILEKLLPILLSESPSEQVVDGLDPMIKKIWRGSVRAHMEQEERRAQLALAFSLWVEMHKQLMAFRKATGYQGKPAPCNDWAEHLKFLFTRTDRSAAVQAYNKLESWKDDRKAVGNWFEEETFALDLASFFSRLINFPYCTMEYLAEEFESYNIELLVWFN